MFCPKCGQERISEATSFCSRCGFLLTGVAELITTGGTPPVLELAVSSPRRRGLRLGLFMFLSMFVLAPLVGIVATFAFRMQPWPVGVIVFLLGGGGLLRIAYALMFESKFPDTPSGISSPEPQISGVMDQRALPEQKTYSVYDSPKAGRWLDTNELEPASVTESTTKLLEKEPQE